MMCLTLYSTTSQNLYQNHSPDIHCLLGSETRLFWPQKAMDIRRVILVEILLYNMSWLYTSVL